MTVNISFDALCAGATGYLLKSSTETMIIDAVHDVVAGGSPMNSSIARKVVEVFAKSKKGSRPSTDLTERERAYPGIHHSGIQQR
jgi:DNA-binding NarL/FixJ family response regulator